MTNILCKLGFHRWEYIWRETNSRAFFTRKCKWCQKIQLKTIGPLGDDKWYDESMAFQNKILGEWEKEHYLKSKVSTL